MRKLLFIIGILFFMTEVSAQGKLEFSKTEITLKNLKADDLEHRETLTIKNTGNQPVIISRITPLTSIVKTEWSREPIAPGKSKEISLLFSPDKLQESFSYKILIYSNAQEKRKEIILKGNLIDNPQKPQLLYKQNINGLKFKSSNINFGQIYTWQSITDTVYYFNSRNESVTLTAQYKPSYLTVNFVPTTTAPSQKGAIIITYNAQKKNDYGYSYESLILNINGVRDFKNRLSVTAKITEDFSRLTASELANAPIASFEKKEINFGEIEKGAKANCDFILTNKGKSTLFIRKTKASCGCTAVALGENALQPGQSTTIRTTFNSAGKSGRQYKSITVITNDPKNPEIVLTISGSIKN